MGRRTYRDMMRQTLTSPLTYLLSFMAVVGLWACVYNSASGKSSEPTSADTADNGEDTVLTAPPPPQWPGARMLRPKAADEAAFGLPIAIMDKKGQSMAAFYKALKRAEQGKGQARIAFYGASHTASEMITGPIREKLQTPLWRRRSWLCIARTPLEELSASGRQNRK